MCGGDIQATDNTYGTCESCGSTMTLPRVADERKANLFNRANHFRRQNDFDKALQTYENILNEDSTDAEAHWGLILSKYGIEYVEDPATGRRIPTCHRVQSDSILSDVDYMSALDNAPDEYTKSLYEEEAKVISEIQKGILAISNNEAPYDVFICYKETTDGGSRTVDSTIAQEIYYQLENFGYRVFFSRLTLEGKLGQHYEPYIFSALNSAKIMLVVGTKPEYFNATWVKNEWSRYLALMKKDRAKLLIPCYRDMDAYDIPDELSSLQSQDMSKVGFIQDILHGVKKVLDASKNIETSAGPATGAIPAAPGVESLMKRGWLFLEDSDWNQADDYFSKVLDINPEHAPAYIGKLCAELKLTEEAALEKHEEVLSDMPNYKKALRFADTNYHIIVDGYTKEFRNRIAEFEKHKQEGIYELISKFRGCISAGSTHTVGLRKDSTVVAVGENDDGQCDVESWRDIVAIFASDCHTVGLRLNGTVVAVGGSSYYFYDISDVEKWRDIHTIAVGLVHVVGIKKSNTVVTVGHNGNGQCGTEDWRDIVAISLGACHTVGLKTDGTVVAVGSNNKGQCDVYDWHNIVAISASSGHTIGLKSNGTVIAVGSNEYEQCNVENWCAIVAISTNNAHTVGLDAGFI